VRTRHELAIDDLPPIENLTITLSDETPIERIGRICHIIDGKLIIIESLLHSPALNDDSVLFNRDRRSIGLVFETFGPVEKPYYSIRYPDIESVHQRQVELNQDVYYAPRETTYTKYVFVQELRALKGSDASWEDDNEPPTFAIDYSDDEQERTAKAIMKGKRSMEGNINEQMMDSSNNDMNRYRKLKLINLFIDYSLVSTQIILIWNVGEVVVVIEDFVVAAVVVIIDLHQVYQIGFKILQIQLLFNIDHNLHNNNHLGKTITTTKIPQRLNFQLQVLHIPIIIIQVYNQHINHFKDIILLIASFLGCDQLMFFVINEKKIA
jgi:rRNA processing protein Gar1